MFALRPRPDHTFRDAVRRLFSMYAAALFLLLVIMIGGVVLTQSTAKTMRDRSDLIALSGMQETLIERIFAVAARIDDTTLTNAAQAKDRENLAQAINTFEQNTAVLYTPDSLRVLYSEPRGGGSPERKARDFTAAARSILADQNVSDATALLRSLSADGLADDQANVTTTLMRASVQDMGMMLRIEFVAFNLAIILILMQFFTVFRPGQTLLRRIFAASAARDRELVQLRATLDQTNTELRHKNAEIEAEKRRLRFALNNAALLSGEQASFTYSVSHDLKSPANTLQLVLDELTYSYAAALPSDARTLINHAQDSVTHMSTLIEDVLQYSWATDPKEAAKTVDLHDMATRVVRALNPLIADTGATVTLGPMRTLDAAPRQIEILLTHLVTNALRFQPIGQAPVVEISSVVGTQSGTTILRVRDNGIGIASRDQRRIFGLFQRLHLRDNYPGTGLGLTTCQRIAANHGGKITINSSLGEGSVFEVTLGALLTEDELLIRDRAA